MKGYKYVVQIIKNDEIVALCLYESLDDYVSNLSTINNRFGEHKWTGFYANEEIINHLSNLLSIGSNGLILDRKFEFDEKEN